MYKLSIIDKISLLLVIIGAINWGLLGLFNFNILNALGTFQLVERIIYILVGVAGINIGLLIARCKI